MNSSVCASRPEPEITGSLFDVISSASGEEADASSKAKLEAASLLDGRNPSLGNLLSSAKASSYVAILCAFAEFRREHEFEPLFEDLQEKTCGEGSGAAVRMEFASD